jgi:hypothetical protein
MEAKKDWRIGLLVKPRLACHWSSKMAYQIVDAKPSGFMGIEDRDGVIVLRYPDGELLVCPASNYVTA